MYRTSLLFMNVELVCTCKWHVFGSDVNRKLIRLANMKIEDMQANSCSYKYLKTVKNGTENYVTKQCEMTSGEILIKI